MISKIKKGVKKAIEQATGYTIIHTSELYDRKTPDYIRWLQTQSINTIIDVGANDGLFLKSIQPFFPESAIHTFEPLKDVFEKLRENNSANERIVFHNCALGSRDGDAVIHRSEFSPSSSLLSMTSSHKDAFPFTKKVFEEKIIVKRLDDVLADYEIQKNVLLKIDVQGFEDQVIKGARKTLQNVFAIIIELSYLELYKGQPLSGEIETLLDKMGFMHVGDVGYLNDPAGKRLQGDGLFVVKKLYQ